MVNPVREIPVTLLSFEKDALTIALGLCPDDRSKESLLHSLKKSGMQDGPIAIGAFQNQYLQREIPVVMASDKIAGTKLDGEVGKELMPVLLARIQEGF